jgi:hypothetical protein
VAAMESLDNSAAVQDALQCLSPDLPYAKGRNVSFAIISEFGEEQDSAMFESWSQGGSTHETLGNSTINIWVEQGKFPTSMLISPTVKVWRLQQSMDWVDKQDRDNPENKIFHIPSHLGDWPEKIGGNYGEW